jgi:hypothetical protein
MDKALHSWMSGYFGSLVNVQKKNGFFSPIVFSLSVFIVKIMHY